MASTSIEVRGLSKRYRLGDRLEVTTLRELVSKTVRRVVARGPDETNGSRASDVIWALDDVSFGIETGEVVGIIGANGAGKSTLLKILARIVEPTRGRAEIRGRVASLLEVGTGFHHDLTGRENVFLNGAILGMRKEEIRAAFDEIVAFAGVERFIDTPVKRYSSGMHVRLAFAVAAHLSPEVMLVDEVLAVGDIGFQRKCLRKMNEVSTSGRTILFVSHNMGAIAELCSRAIVIERGRLVMDGSPAAAIERYTQSFATNARPGHPVGDDTLAVSFVSVTALKDSGIPASTFDLNEPVTLAIRYRVNARVDGLMIVLTLARNGVDVFHTYDCDLDAGPADRTAGEYEARYRIPPMFLKAGVYTAALASTTAHIDFQRLDSAIVFEVSELSVNTHLKGFRQDRAGQVVGQGTWQTARL